MRKILLGTLLASCLASNVALAQSAPVQPVAQPPVATPALAPAAPPVAAPAPSTTPRVIVPAQAEAPRVIAPAPQQATPAMAPAAAPVVLGPGPVTAPDPAQVQVAAPAALPPPPPGYVYARVADAPPLPPVAERREQIYGELQRVDGRLRELGAQRHKVSLGGPIAMMAIGYGATLVSSLVALASLGTAEAIEHEDWWDENDADFNDDGTINHRDERAARNTARAFAGVAVMSLGLGIGGTVWFSKRMSERRTNAPEIHDLKERRRDLRRELRYGAMIAPDHAQLTLRTQF